MITKSKAEGKKGMAKENIFLNNKKLNNFLSTDCIMIGTSNKVWKIETNTIASTAPKVDKLYLYINIKLKNKDKTILAELINKKYKGNFLSLNRTIALDEKESKNKIKDKNKNQLIL